MPPKPKKKDPVHPRHLSLDERLIRLAEQAESDRERAEADRAHERERMAEMTKRAEADHDRAAEMTKRAEADRDQAMADRDRAFADRDRSLADRDRLARLEEKVVVDHKNNQGHRGKLSRALEDAFAASLPRAMKTAHGIVIRPKDIRLRVRENLNSREFDFIAPNGELVLAGEVKTHLTLDDVVRFSEALQADFRRMFPEYAGLPVHGVVAGGVIEDDAARHAYKRGFIILRLEGAEVHPATAADADYRPKAY